MKLRHYVLFLVLLSIAILTVAIPVTAALDEVNQGNWIFIGEKDLDVTNAVGGYTQIAWWDTTSDPSINPADIIVNVGDVTNFDVDSRFNSPTFGWATGQWYRYAGSFSNDTAFYVVEPSGYVTINDLAFAPPANDVTGGTAFIGDLIDFKISSDLRLILTQRGGGTFNFRLHVMNPDGVSLNPLYTLTGTRSLINLPLDNYPWYWSSQNSVSSNAATTWKTNETDGMGFPYYTPGVYTVWFSCNENQLNYVSPSWTVTLEEEQPELTVSTSSLIRGGKFTTEIRGIPNTNYIVWIKDCVACPNGCCSDQMTGDCCDQPPLIMQNQENVSFFDAKTYSVPCDREDICNCSQYDTCEGSVCPECFCGNGQGDDEEHTIADTLIKWCGCLCTKTLWGIMPKNPEIAKYSFALVRTDENGVRNFTWQTSTCTAPTSYKIHTQRWEENDVCELDPDRPFDEACVNVQKGEVTINTEVCDVTTDSTFLGENVRIYGKNTDSKVTYLFIKGPCQSCLGEDMELNGPVENWQNTSFTRVNVTSKGDWEYIWYTRNLQIDLGEYTIYAASMPNDAPALEGVACTDCSEAGDQCAAWDKTQFTFLEPTLTADVNPKILQIICCAPTSIIVDGEAMGLRGEAIGQEYDTVPIGVWVFGENKVAGQKYVFEAVNVDCVTGEYKIDLKYYIETLALQPGTYTVVVQHPMYNHRLDIIPEDQICEQSEWCWWLRLNPYIMMDEVWYPDTNRKFVVTATPVRWSKLFVIEGPDRLAGTAALNALLAGFNDPNIDDKIVVLTFKVESNNALQAGFSGTPTTGGSPLSVQFTDISIGSPTTWSWDFGDGFTSTEQNPLHVYQNAGTYSVTLSVTGLSGSSSVTKNGYISVTTGPTQTGTVTPTPTQAPSTVNLYTGWNLISTPRTLAIGQNTAGVVFAGVLDKTGGRPLWLYDASSGWISMDSGTIVKPLDGIWIYQTSPSTVTLTYKNDPTELPPTKNLYSGWNLIGFSDVSPVSAKGTLISVKNQWSIAMGFNAVTQQYETPAIINDVNDGTLMNPMKGYWLFMNAPGTLAAISA